MQPWQLGAAEAAELIRNKELSPVELTESCLERVGQLHGEAAGCVDVERGGAPRAAAAWQEALHDALGAGERPPALAGVPLGVKDVIDVAGLPTTASSK